MGSQSLEIIRSFLASFCGGFLIFDPHSGVFCNCIHLYLWLFLLCFPFVAYLYFPTTYSTWVVYTIVATCVITVLKIINIALHSMYDKARTMSETSLKKSKIPREVSCDDEPGIEMQILSTVVETPPVELSSRTSVDDVHDEISCANSAISCDYPDNVNSTIDLKADVHRKNSSESSDSIGLYAKNQIHSSVVETHAAEVCHTANHRRSASARNELNKQKSQESGSVATGVNGDNSTVIDLGGSGDSISVVWNLDDMENSDIVAPNSITSTGSVSKRSASSRRGQYKSMKTKRTSSGNSSSNNNNNNSNQTKSGGAVTKLHRQISLDSEKIGMGAIYINESGPCLQLQRHLSSEDQHNNKSNASLFQGHFLTRNNHHHHHHHHHHLHNHYGIEAADLYLENNYTTKSALQLAIENNVPEEDQRHHMHLHGGAAHIAGSSSSAVGPNKTFLSQQNVTPTIRRDSNSTMSALQLPTAASTNVLAKSAGSSSKLRRHSNTSGGGVGGSGGVRPLPRSLTSVRRIKSAALEICCPPASVSNLSPHPNSVEVIGGQTIRNPQQAVLPPPSKCLSRNPQINLFPSSKGGSGQLTFGDQSAVVVYPIAEQSDENASVSGKNFGDSPHFERSTDSEYESESLSGNEEEDGPSDSSSRAQPQMSQQQQRGGNSRGRRKHATTSDSDTDDDDEKYDDLEYEGQPASPQPAATLATQPHRLPQTGTTTTDSDTENNGSRSPLLEVRRTNVPVIIVEQNERKKVPKGDEPTSSPDATSSSVIPAAVGVAGDWEQASGTSKDMLVTKGNPISEGFWYDFFPGPPGNEESVAQAAAAAVAAIRAADAGKKFGDPQADDDEPSYASGNFFNVREREVSEPPSQQSTGSSANRNLGAIPKKRNGSLRRQQSMGGAVNACEDFVPIRTYTRGSSQRMNAARLEQHRAASVAPTTCSAPLITFLNYRSDVPMPPIYLPGSSSLIEQQRALNNFNNSRPNSNSYHQFQQFQSRLRRSRYAAQLVRQAANAEGQQLSNPGIDELFLSGCETSMIQSHHQLQIPGADVDALPTNFLVDEHGNWMQYTINKSLLDERRMIMDPSGGGVGGSADQQRCVRVQYSASSGQSANDVGATRLSASNGASAIFGNADTQYKSRSYYKFPVGVFGIEKELKISMTRLQLLALFDRDMNWFQVVLAIMLAVFVSVLGSIILYQRFYEDLYAFIFCFVIAGSQYSLLKSVQPDAASPIHGFNKTVTYSRPIYFCLCASLLLMAHELSQEYKAIHDNGLSKPMLIFGYPILLYELFETFTYLLSAVILFFPLIFCLGLFPQINTFLMYLLEQVDMHAFGGNASCSLLASFVAVTRSILACLLLYGPVFGALGEPKGSQHILFSMFCALLVPVAYHLSRTASDVTYVWALIKSSLIFHFDDDEKETAAAVAESMKEPSYAAIPRDSTKSGSASSNSECNSICAGNNSVEQIKMSTLASRTDMKMSSDDDEDAASASSGVLNTQLDGVSGTEADTNNNLDDPLPKKLQHTVTSRLKNDLVVCPVLAIIIFSLHCSTIFTVLQPDINYVLYIVAVLVGFLLHYMIPQMRKHLPWLCVARPILKQQEFGLFEVKYLSKVMWFEQTYVGLCFFERNVLYPLIFLSALTADAGAIASKFGLPCGTLIIVICGVKCLRSAYSDQSSQYLILIFTFLFFHRDFKSASETFLIDYFFVSIVFKKICELLLKLQFVVTYIAPWQITWGSAFHAFAQPFSVPHSAMLFLQSAISALLSTPLNPFLGSAIFLTSYVRPIKFWERDYNTRRIDHSNTRLSSQLERDLGADDNNLNSIFYEHLTRSLQHSLCGDLMMGRWGNVSQGDCFVLASDYLNCLVHIIELGNGLCTFQMRGLEFRGTYCQQREVEAISEGVEENDGCCCCSPGHLPRMLSANAMFSTRWLAWQVIASQYVLEGYSISDNSAIATLQVFEYRKVLISYYVKSIIYYTIRSQKLQQWLQSSAIQEALKSTLDRMFVDVDPVFNHNLDDDYDFRMAGITRNSFCSVYLEWIQFCCSKRQEQQRAPATSEGGANNNNNNNNNNANKNTRTTAGTTTTPSPRSSSNPTPSPRGTIQQQPQTTGSMPPQPPTLPTTTTNTTLPKPNITVNNNETNQKDQPTPTAPPAAAACTIDCSKESVLVSLCLGLALLARRTLATASHSSSSGVEFFLHGLHALFKGDFRITSIRDEWVFADMDLLHGVIAPAVRMSLKLHQDHFLSPDEYEQFDALYEAIDSHTKELVISHEADPLWRNAVLRGTPNLLALRHVMEDGSDEYRVIRLSKRYLSFRVIKLNRECVRGLWAGQQQELIYLRNRNPERGSIQNAKQALRNIINSSCDQPIGYPIYVSQLTTSYADTNEQVCGIIGGEITLEKIQNMVLSSWDRVRKRCREGCSSGSSGLVDGELGDVQSVYCGVSGMVPTPQNTLSGMAGTMSYGSQSMSLSTGNRGSLLSINKPTSSTLLAGLLNRERDVEREAVRERNIKRANNSAASRQAAKRESFREHTSNNSSLKQQESVESSSGVGPFKSNNSSTVNLTSNVSSSSIHLQQQQQHFHQGMGNTLMVGSSGIIFGNLQATSGPTPKMYECRRASMDHREHEEPEEALLMSPTIGINKKVIIVDANQIYDCLDLGRRIDVIWPNEQYRASGGRSSWKEWQPSEGMVGYVVHYWQPNHSDNCFRSNVNRTILLLKIGERFVPVGERGVKEYNMLTAANNKNTSLSSLPAETSASAIEEIGDEEDASDTNVAALDDSQLHVDDLTEHNDDDPAVDNNEVSVASVAASETSQSHSEVNPNEALPVSLQ